jgi:hypothetical protein
VVLARGRIAEDRNHTAADKPLRGSAPPFHHLAQDVHPRGGLTPGALRVGVAQLAPESPNVGGQDGDELALLAHLDGRHSRDRFGVGRLVRRARPRLQPIALGRQFAGHDVCVQSPQLLPGLDAQLLAQTLDEPAVPADRDMPVALPCGEAHQARVRLLVHRVDVDQPLERRDRAPVVAARLAVGALIEEKAHHAGAQLRAARRGPLIEAVLRKEVAGVEGECLLGVAPLRRGLKRVDVDPQLVGLQAEQVVP